jgi:hypothetical protein
MSKECNAIMQQGMATTGWLEYYSVWEQSFSAVLEEYCSILKYCSIIYIMVFGKLGKISVFKTEVLQIL